MQNKRRTHFDLPLSNDYFLFQRIIYYFQSNFVSPILASYICCCDCQLSSSNMLVALVILTSDDNLKEYVSLNINS